MAGCSAAANFLFCALPPRRPAGFFLTKPGLPSARGAADWVVSRDPARFAEAPPVGDEEAVRRGADAEGLGLSGRGSLLTGVL